MSISGKNGGSNGGKRNIQPGRNIRVRERAGKAGKGRNRGELGVGKTVFTQGFAAGLGIEEPVNSPTFTILQIYEEGRLPLYHFDVYRIEEPEEMDEIGYEDYFYGDGVCLIEWASMISELIPETAIQVTIKKDLEHGFDYRTITVEERFGEKR